MSLLGFRNKRTQFLGLFPNSCSAPTAPETPGWILPSAPQSHFLLEQHWFQPLNPKSHLTREALSLPSPTEAERFRAFSHPLSDLFILCVRMNVYNMFKAEDNVRPPELELQKVLSCLKGAGN